MKRVTQLLIITVSVLFILTGCRALDAPAIKIYAPIEGYKYIYITPTKELTAGYGYTRSDAFLGTRGLSTMKSVNPRDIISGELIKQGFVILPELQPELNTKTFIVNYGESGRKSRGLGYTIEVTLQFLSADKNAVVCTCTAEGQGETEADDIRIAIKRALAGFFTMKENSDTLKN